jgi:hypothetical protein
MATSSGALLTSDREIVDVEHAEIDAAGADQPERVRAREQPEANVAAECELASDVHPPATAG